MAMYKHHDTHCERRRKEDVKIRQGRTPRKRINKTKETKTHIFPSMVGPEKKKATNIEWKEEEGKRGGEANEATMKKRFLPDMSLKVVVQEEEERAENNQLHAEGPVGTKELTCPYWHKGIN